MLEGDAGSGQTQLAKALSTDFNVDYTGEKATHDMKDNLQEFRRKGIQFLAAAIGQDKEAVREIYGAENTLDITDLKQPPARLLLV